MTEYTIVYTAEITEVVKTDEPLENMVYSDKNAIANWIGAKLNADDVSVKNIKVFPREIES